VAESATQQLLLELGDVDMAKNLTPDQIVTLDPTTIKVEVLPPGRRALPVLQPEDRKPDEPRRLGGCALPRGLRGHDEQFPRRQMEIHQAFWPKGFPGSLDETPFTYDPERAKQILADAGVTLPIDVTLDVITRALHGHGAVAPGELRRGRASTSRSFRAPGRR
jgi:peptide/nickel transport system substrate-binding protein